MQNYDDIIQFANLGTRPDQIQYNKGILQNAIKSGVLNSGFDPNKPSTWSWPIKVRINLGRGDFRDVEFSSPEDFVANTSSEERETIKRDFMSQASGLSYMKNKQPQMPPAWS